MSQRISARLVRRNNQPILSQHKPKTNLPTHYLQATNSFSTSPRLFQKKNLKGEIKTELNNLSRQTQGQRDRLEAAYRAKHGKKMPKMLYQYRTSIRYRGVLTLGIPNRARIGCMDTQFVNIMTRVYQTSPRTGCSNRVIGLCCRYGA